MADPLTTNEPDVPLVVPVKVQFEFEVKTSAVINLVEHFTNMSPFHRSQYFTLDLAETGFEQEFERPIAWLMDVLQDEAMGFGSAMVTGGSAGFSDGDISDPDIRVHRDDRDRYGSWAEADFDALVVAVPWLRPPEPPDDEDLKRMPGPNDVHLF